MHQARIDSAETNELLQRVREGDQQALEQLLARHRQRLHDFVDGHLEPRMRARIDPSDLVQETQLEVARRMDDFLRRQPMPFHLWVRKTAYEHLLRARRDHRRARRSVEREQRWPDRSSLLLARSLQAAVPSPSRALQTKELAESISRAMASLAEADREILLLRDADELPYEDIACLLEIDPAAARKRYGRALIRLQKTLTERGIVE
jgi:RNA polymerase sigma-70 factor (ECF subfamily)